MKFGIAHPIYNYRFNRPNRWMTTFSSLSTKTVTPGTFPSGSAANSDNLFGCTEAESMAGDYAGKINRVILGPSAHSSNVGAVEEIFVDHGNTGTTKTIVLEDAPGYSYSSGDDLTMIGLGCPDGWVGCLPGGSTAVFSNGQIVNGDGYTDPFGFNILNGSAATYDQAYLKIGRLIANHYYRLEVYYKGDSGTGNDYLTVYDGGAAAAAGDCFFSNTSGAWASVSAVFKSHDHQDAESYLLLSHSSPDTTIVQIASISLTHAPYDQAVSGGGTVYDQVGVSDISDYPILGSIVVNRIHPGSQLTSGNFYRYQSSFQKYGELPVVRYEINYQFFDVSFEMADLFFQLLEWQERGNLINHFPGLAAVPYCLCGRISVSGLKKRMTSTSRSDLNVTFTEVAV